MIRYLVVIICLGAVTLLVVDMDARFRIVDDGFQEQLALGSGDWQQSPGGVTRLDTDPVELELMGRGTTHVSYVTRLIPQVQSYDYLRVSAEIQTESLAGVSAPWHGGRVLLVSFDQRRRRLWYWPSEIANLEGSNAWRWYSAVIPVAPNGGGMQLIVYAAAESGSMRLRHPRIETVEETPLISTLRLAIIGGWVLMGLWLVAALSSRPLRSPSRLATMLLAGLVIAAGIVPQPHLNDALKTVLFRAQDIVFVSSDFLQELAANIEGGDAGGDHGILVSRAADDPEALAREGDDQAAASPQAHTSSDEQAAAHESQSRYWVPPWDDLDKKEHLAAFFLLGFLAGLAYRQYPPVGVLLALILLAGSIQAMQSLSITRSPDVGDLGYDLTGIMMGFGMAYLLRLLARVFPSRGASNGDGPTRRVTHAR